MRKFFALTLMTLTMATTVAFAQDATPAADSLKHHMKDAGTLFKAIGQTINDASKNAENAQKAGQMAEIFRLALSLTPDHIQDLPAAQQSQALKGYQEMIQKVIDHALALQQAFANNDNVTANAIYKEMKDLKQDGHDQYDP
jgi:soluble cytochrome b562